MLDGFDSLTRLAHLVLDRNSHIELQFEFSFRFGERRFAGFQLLANLLSAGTELGQLRFHPRKTLRSGVLAGAPALELNRHFLSRLSILIGLLPYPSQFVA